MNTLAYDPWLGWLETTVPIPERVVPYCPHTLVAPCPICQARATEGGAE